MLGFVVALVLEQVVRPTGNERNILDSRDESKVSMETDMDHKYSLVLN